MLITHRLNAYSAFLGQGSSGLRRGISYNIVIVMLGGRIEVSSELGQAAGFRIEIPLTASEELAVAV